VRVQYDASDGAMEIDDWLCAVIFTAFESSG
jgi:hypothetical protein